MQKIIAIGIFFVRCVSLYAQSGCTDPQASNFDINALTNDGSCVYPATSASTPVVTNLDPVMEEASALAFFSGLVWTLNDSGGDPVLFGFDTLTGNITREWHVRNFGNTDWEAMTSSASFVYIGDFGNNNGTRTDLKILRLSLDSLDQQPYDTTSAEVISFTYPDQQDFTGNSGSHNYDCEAMLYFGDSLHLFSKHRSNGFTKHYVLPALPGSYQAILRDSVWVGGQVTDAAVSQDSIIVLCGYEPPFYAPFIFILRDFKDHAFFSGHKRRINLGTVLNNGQQEGIVFTHSSRGFIASEKVSAIGLAARIYRFDITGYISEPFLTAGSLEEVAQVYPNPFTQSVQISIPDYTQKINIRLSDTSGKTILKETLSLQGNGYVFSPKNLKEGLYILQVEAGNKKYYTRLLKERE